MAPNLFNGLDRDIQEALKAQLRNLWTHHSTALEGNSLSLGETAFVIDEGLTISGKPLKDHHEVIGHAKAIDLIYDLVDRSEPISEQVLFDLHKAVQTSLITDVYKPIGAWKNEPNGTNTVNSDGKQIFIEFAKPATVPMLMNEWLKLFNQYLTQSSQSQELCLQQYVNLHVAFVRIHPFFDGNGRMARLLSNVPILKAGFPPIVIPKEIRFEYIRALASYELAVGQAQLISGLEGEALLLPQSEKLSEFRRVCERAWNESQELVEQAKEQQKKRT